jgi:hypothetical protein
MKICSHCQEPKAQLVCGACGKDICKTCREYIDTNSFSFMAKAPQHLTKGEYCPACFEDVIVPAQAAYDATMKSAAEVFYLSKNYPGYIHMQRKHTKRVVVTECDDRRECIMRLAFFAVELGFNGIIEAEVESFKIRKNNRQSSYWKGSALPAKIDGERLERAALRGF